MSKFWYVYLLRCADNSLYCGITTDINRRLREHNETKKGAKYTRSRRPVTVEWVIETPDRSCASRVEAKIKKMDKKTKEKIVNNKYCIDHHLDHDA